MDGLDQLIIIQLVYIAILWLIIRAATRQGKKTVFYWVVTGLYLLVIAWLGVKFVNMPGRDGGYWFALGMYSIVVPGILIFIAVIVFMVTRAVRKKR